MASPESNAEPDTKFVGSVVGPRVSQGGFLPVNGTIDYLGHSRPKEEVMSTEKTLDQMLAEIDAILNEEEENPLRDPGTIVAVKTQQSIQYTENNADNVSIYTDLPMLGPLPDVLYNPIICQVMNHANNMCVSIRRSAMLLGITVEEVREIRRSRQYLAVVKDRINRNDRESLLARMYRWATPIDRVYAKYFGVPIDDIRHILEDIFPGWSEVYNDSQEVRDQIYRAMVSEEE